MLRMEAGELVFSTLSVVLCPTVSSCLLLYVAHAGTLWTNVEGISI